MAVVAMLLLGIYFVLNTATIVYCIWSWLRRFGEEDETFVAGSPFQSKAEPTLVNGQVTD